MLIFAAAALAYMWWPQSFDKALANNKLYTIIVLLAVYWFVTLFTFRGIAGVVETELAWRPIRHDHSGRDPDPSGRRLRRDGQADTDAFEHRFFPDFSNFHNMVLAAGIFLYYAGMEMQAVHVRNLKNPSRNYPLSVLIATIMVVAIFVLGTLAVGVVIPQKAIDLNQGLLVAYRDLWSAFGLPWLGNVMAAMLAFGVLGQVSVIVAGPSTGLLAVGKAGYLPHILQKTNAHGIPVPILLLQGALVTILCVAFTVLPSVQSAYQILSQMATIIYLVMYMVMYVAAIRLRYTQPDKVRPFKSTRRQFRHVGRRHRRLAGRSGRAGLQLHSPQPDQHRQSRRLYRHSAGGLRRLCSHSLHSLCLSQAKLEGAEFGFRAVRVAS